MARSFAKLARRVLSRVSGGGSGEGAGIRDLRLDYPIHPTPRYGYGRPAHARLAAILERGRSRYRETLEGILDYRADLCRIPRDGNAGSTEPHWINVWLPGLDAAALYGILRRLRPARYFEVGSGHSTAFARRAIRDGELTTRIVSIDPAPRRAIEDVCDRVHRERLENVGPELFDELEAGDVLFVDSSHYCFMNSDATVVFLDVLPRLRPGVWVQLHDIFLPYDYPPGINDSFRLYSEQYLLAASLLAAPDFGEVVLPSAFVGEDAELSRILLPLWEDPALAGVPPTGGSFWFVTRDRRG